MSEKCSALVTHDGRTACKNGFPVHGSCLGAAGTPPCMRVEWCGMAYNYNGGKPKTLAEKAAEQPPQSQGRQQP